VLTVRPREFSAPAWDKVLGGDGTIDTNALDGLSDLGSDTADVLAVARAVVVADVSGVGRDAYPAYFADTQPAACTNVTATAASAYSLGEISGVHYAKALVVWSGSCSVPVPSAALGAVYLTKQGNSWQPEAPGMLPQQQETPLSSEVPDWALEALVCSNGQRARIEVALAWEQMCKAAAADGIALNVVSGWRSAAEQQDRFEGAVEFYGSREEARRHVAISEREACASRHCAGEAIDVEMTTEAAAWLRQVVACRRVDGSIVEVSSCRENERGVLRLEQYGFAEPLATSPGHLEYTMALNELSGGACADAPSAQVPTLIIEVFKCSTRELGPVSATLLRQALVVAECSSGWNPAAKMLDGLYANSAHPATGKFYDGVGLFGLTQRQVSKLVAGGEAADAWQHALAAARLYVAETQAGRDGWGPFVCGAGDAAVPSVIAPTSWPAWMTLYVPES
jgi:D-alanyl-D-alanine carboxypeptidase